MKSDVPKALLTLTSGDGNPTASIIRRTVETFCGDNACQLIVVCIPSEWEERFRQELRGLDKILFVHGGATRQESVRLGVEALSEALEGESGASDLTCVLIHDGARCCVSQDIISRVVAGVREYGAVTAAVPVPDTLTKVQEGLLSSPVDREGVWAVQTPQGFLLGELRSAHYAAKVDRFEALDDASVVARLRPVRVVAGDRFNIKVTHPDDLNVAARILK
jgi:2-C-methyl-D-erythritol 4-phosphate cytidylyltransferase